MNKKAQITEYLTERIATGELATGAKLPSQTVLMRQFEVSRTTVVQALEELRRQGRICGQQGRGVYVREIHRRGVKQIFVIGENLHFDRQFPFSEMIFGLHDAERRLTFMPSKKFTERSQPSFHNGQAIMWLLPDLHLLGEMEHLRRKEIPQLLINRDYEDFDCIVTDTESSLRKGLSWLISTGGRNLAIILCPPQLSRPFRQERLLTTYELCIELNATLSKDLIFKCEYSMLIENLDSIVRSIFLRTQPPRSIFILDRRLVVPFVICATKYNKELGRDYVLLMMDESPELIGHSGIGMLRQPYPLFQLEIENWLKMIASNQIAPFKKQLQCTLDVF